MGLKIKVTEEAEEESLFLNNTLACLNTILYICSTFNCIPDWNSKARFGGLLLFKSYLFAHITKKHYFVFKYRIVYLPKRNFKRRQERKKGSNQAFYKSAQWRKVRAAYLSQYPLCQVADYFDDIEPGKIVDHIIPISHGGAKYDPRNLQTLGKKIHDIKSTIEGNESRALVDYTINQDGDFIPVCKSDIWRTLEKHYRLLALRQG